MRSAAPLLESIADAYQGIAGLDGQTVPGPVQLRATSLDIGIPLGLGHDIRKRRSDSRTYNRPTAPLQAAYI
jgi:hypothetical protein